MTDFQKHQFGGGSNARLQKAFLSASENVICSSDSNTISTILHILSAYLPEEHMLMIK